MKLSESRASTPANALRAARGITVRRLADIVELPTPTVHRYLSGYTAPDVEAACAIAAALRADADIRELFPQGVRP